MQAMPTPQDSIASEAKSAAAKYLAQAAIEKPPNLVYGVR
jgi:hypothetical protein